MCAAADTHGTPKKISCHCEPARTLVFGLQLQRPLQQLHRFGVHPPLRVGEGGRDGEGGDLAWFLQRVLDGEASEGS